MKTANMVDIARCGRMIGIVLERKIMSAMICLITAAIGISTLLHEYCHLAVAGLLGHHATLGPCTLTSGSVFIHSSMSPLDTALIAAAGSAGLIIAGIPMVRFRASSAVRMAGMVFLSRAWIDALPLYDMDGAFVAQSIGIQAAWLIAIAEIMICGSVIRSEIFPAQKIRRFSARSAHKPHRSLAE